MWDPAPGTPARKPAFVFPALWEGAPAAKAKRRAIRCGGAPFSSKFHDMAHATLRKSSRNRSRMPAQPGPRPDTVNAILNYSKALKVVEIPPVGQVHVVLN